MNRVLAIGIAMAVGWGSVVSAHDFWIEPSVFAAKVPASVSLRLRVGENFSGSAVRRNTGMIAKFVSSGPTGEVDVPGLEGRDPAGFLRIDEPGDYVVGYETLGQSIELAADRFESYLREEGLEHVIETRRAAKQSDRPGREIFFRCAKTLVRAEGAPDPNKSSGDRVLGLTLELLLEDGSYENGSEIGTRMRLLFHGEPVGNALVVGLRRGDDREAISARTNPDGRVSLPMAPGEWLVKAVHMVPAQVQPAADWKSYWASITFSTVGRSGPP